MNELISVIIPVYNAEKNLRETIDSLLAQTYQNFEAIFIDDGSTDTSVEIIKSYDDNRIIILQQKNSGSATARNNGISAANGDWIAFLDADDVWFSEKLMKQYQCVKTGYWSYTDSYFLGGVFPEKTSTASLSGHFSGEVFSELVQRNFIGTSTVLVRKKMLVECGKFSVDMKALQDWDCWLKIASKYPVIYVGEPLSYYRVHSQSVSRSARKTITYHRKLIDKIFSNDGIASSYANLKNISLFNSYSICSIISDQEGDYCFSFRCALRAFMLRPRNPRRLLSIFRLSILCVLSLFKINGLGKN
jgi:glycosyltransferase involved in cell wall biosynthesis